MNSTLETSIFLGFFDIERRKIYHARLMYARPFIDSLEFARNGRQMSGEVPVAELPRLQDMLFNPQGVLSYVISGGVEKQGSHFLDVSVTGHCQLVCQRCLEGLVHPVQIDTRLLLLDEAKQGVLDDEDAESDSIPPDAHLDVLSLLEDEILLSLPIAPRHEIGACQAAGSHQAHGEERRPFAILEKLKRN